MNCANCQKDIAAGSKFCYNCGAKQPEAASPSVPPAYTSRKRLVRSINDRKIAGVCAGVADYFDLDPLLVRVLWALAVLCASAGVTGSSSAGPAHPAVAVGTRCQQDYQNNWQVDVGSNDVWNRCGNFNKQIRKTEDLKFYYNLHGAKAVIEKTSDGCG